MTLDQAKRKVAVSNPDAIFVATAWFKGEPDSFEIWDFTYSDEVRSRIGYYDCVTEALTHPDGDVWR